MSIVIYFQNYHISVREKINKQAYSVKKNESSNFITEWKALPHHQQQQKTAILRTVLWELADL